MSTTQNPPSNDYVTTSAPARMSPSERDDPYSSPGKPKASGFLLLTMIVAILVLAACQILILVQAFKAGVGWGLGSLFIPFVSMIFVISHWDETKRPFLTSLGTSVLFFLVALNS